MTMKNLFILCLAFFSAAAHGQLHEMGMQCALMDTTFVPLPENGLSYNGYVHTPKGQLKMLIVFVSSEEDNNDVINA